MTGEETTPIIAEMILWARMGGYSTIIILLLSLIITILSFKKRNTNNALLGPNSANVRLQVGICVKAA